MAVERYMTVNPITIQSSDSIWDALKIIRRHRVRHLPVIQGKQLVGMFTDRDLRLVAPSSLALPEEQERFRDWGGQAQVGDVMTRKVVTVTPEAGTDRAARLMVDHRIGSLPVSSEGPPWSGSLPPAICSRPWPGPNRHRPPPRRRPQPGDGRPHQIAGTPIAPRAPRPAAREGGAPDHRGHRC